MAPISLVSICVCVCELSYNFSFLRNVRAYILSTAWNNKFVWEALFYARVAYNYWFDIFIVAYSLNSVISKFYDIPYHPLRNEWVARAGDH